MPRSRDPKQHKAQVAAARRRGGRGQPRSEMKTNWAGRGFQKKPHVVVQSPSPPRRRGRPPKGELERTLDKQLREIQKKDEEIRDGVGRIGEVVAYHAGPRYFRLWVRAERKEGDECITDSPVTLKIQRRARSYGS